MSTYPFSKPARHSFTVLVDDCEVCGVGAPLRRIAREAGFSEERCADIQAAASWACTGVLEHISAGSQVELEILVFEDRLEVQAKGSRSAEDAASSGETRPCEEFTLPLSARLSDHLAAYSSPLGGLLVALTFYRPGFVGRHGAEVLPPSIMELVKEKEVTSAILGSITDELWFVDANKNVKLVNPAAVQEFGQAASGGRPIEEIAAATEVYRPDGTPRPVGEAPPLRALRGEVVKDLEEVVRTPAAGALRNRRVNAAPVRDASGTIIGAVATVRDVTEYRQAEELLRESETRYHSVLDNMAEGILILDADRNLVYQNAASARIHGYLLQEDGSIPREELAAVWEGWDETGLPLPIDEWPLSRVARGVAFQDFVLRARRVDTGYEFWGSYNGCAVKDRDGRFAYGFVTLNDVTVSKQAQKMLIDREEQLRQSQKMEAVGQLAGGIAHDFNNLLTTIIGYSGLVLSSPEFAQTAWFADVTEVKNAAERASALTRQILAFSRRQALRPQIVSLNEVLTGMKPMLQRTLGEDIDLVSLQHQGLGYAEVDVHQFEQVLMNLALNARDAMPSGGRLTLESDNVELGEEYCEARAGVVPGSYVMLAVSDNGIGMDEETLQHVFEPFFTTKPPGEGTGLGLATVYGIVKQSNGSMSAYSEPGKGTTFKIYLPRVAQDLQHTDAPDASTAVSTGGSETILLVEDEISLRTLATRILTELGYRVWSAGTVSEALSLVADADCRLHLLLTDLVLPGGLQGKDLAQRLTAANPDLPVLYMSGYTRNAIVHAGRLDEGVNFLEKPFKAEQLAAAVRAALDQARR